MTYLPPVDLLARAIDISAGAITPGDGRPRFGRTYDEFINIFRMTIKGGEVDEAWYKATDEEIGPAIDDSRVASA